MVLIILATAAVVVVIALGSFVLMGTERLWSFFGQPDLGPVAFQTLKRRKTPNDALACPANLCQAKSDLVPPVFAVDAKALQAAMAKVVASEPRTVLVEANGAELTERYIQRSALLRFPDTIVVRYIEQSQRRSTLALYSRSQLGHGDLGANLARLKRWLGKLEKVVPTIG
jgi:uncharacterized protein (DUF1499 family)